jgi:hypothetical protein
VNIVIKTPILKETRVGYVSYLTTGTVENLPAKTPICVHIDIGINGDMQLIQH